MMTAGILYNKSTAVTAIVVQVNRLSFLSIFDIIVEFKLRFFLEAEWVFTAFTIRHSTTTNTVHGIKFTMIVCVVCRIAEYLERTYFFCYIIIESLNLVFNVTVVEEMNKSNNNGR